MSESKLQTKILTYLKNKGYWVFKTVVCNRNGIPDIVGCTNEGRMFVIEVKYGKGKASALQEYNLAEVKKRGAISIIAWDLETVKAQL